MLVILSGVAGAGKDTVKKELMKRMKDVDTLPSYTSRPKREGDVEGGTYNFVSKEQFEEMIENGDFYEYDVHHDNYYGTSKKLLNDKIKEGKIIVKDIKYSVQSPNPHQVLNLSVKEWTVMLIYDTK